MGFLTEHCSFHLLKRDIIATCQPFSCGNPDLDEFFLKDSPLYTENLLGKTYCYLLDEDPTVIVCAFTLSNDSVRVDQLPTLKYYEKNGFHYLFSTEMQESENACLPLPLKTRYMYFDLIDVIRK